MKKIIIVLLLFVFTNICFAASEQKEVKEVNKYKKLKTITFNDYLYSPKNKRNSLKLNKNKDVIYNNKVILKEDGRPLNEHTAETDTELKILFVAMKIKPKKNCNPLDTVKNGTLGCYIDNPDE